MIIKIQLEFHLFASNSTDDDVGESRNSNADSKADH